MNENIDDGKCDRKVYKVITSSRTKTKLNGEKKKKQKIRESAMKTCPVACSLIIDQYSTAREKNRQKFYLKKNKILGVIVMKS